MGKLAIRQMRSITTILGIRGEEAVLAEIAATLLYSKTDEVPSSASQIGNSGGLLDAMLGKRQLTIWLVMVI